MTILTGARRKTGDVVLEDLSVGASVGTAFGQAFAFNPTTLMVGEEARRDADLGYRVDPFSGVVMSATPSDDPSQQIMSPDDLNKEYGHLGLSFGKPTKKAVADILAEQKRVEVERQSILDRATPGVLAGGARLGAQLLASVADPINVASAFIPVVPEARYAIWGARLGMPAARLARGGIEGAVGAVAVEPLVYGLSQQQHADYTMTDSLLNVAFGTALGGGLHVAGGAVGDLLARRAGRGAPTMQERVSSASQTTREAALRTALAQDAQGDAINVAPILEADRGYRSPRQRDRTNDNSLTEQLDRLREGGKPLSEPESLMGFLKRYGGIKLGKHDSEELKALGITTKTHPGLISKKGADLDTIGRALVDEGFLDADPRYGRADIHEVLDAIGRELSGDKQYRTHDAVDVEAFRAQEQLREDISRHGIDINKADDTVLEALTRAYDSENGVDVSGYGERTLDDLAAEDYAELSASMERMRDEVPSSAHAFLEDYAAIEWADARLAEAPETFATVDDAQAALDDASELFDVLNEALDHKPDLSALDAEIADAMTMERGARAAAACLLRS